MMHRLPACLLLLAVTGCTLLKTPPEPGGLASEDSRPAAPYCTRPDEKAAADVVALKTWLMVLALTCQERPGYNSFVTNQRAGLERHEAVLTDYFRRNYGTHATAAHDDYITQLANFQSQTSLAQGAAFCANNNRAMGDVREVNGVEALATYATTHEAAQPERFEICGATAAN